MNRLVLYVAHPLAPLPEDVAADTQHPTPHAAALQVNLARAMRWLSWLRRSFPETTFIAPWIAAVLSGEDDADPRQREAGLVDACAVIPRLDGVVLCGGRVSAGMLREIRHTQRWWDLTCFLEPPDAGAIGGFEYWAEKREVRR